MPRVSAIVSRAFGANPASGDFSAQWKNPADIFSVLLILGGDVVSRALAQLGGSRFTPVTFSFGMDFLCSLSYVCGSSNNLIFVTSC